MACDCLQQCLPKYLLLFSFKYAKKTWLSNQFIGIILRIDDEDDVINSHIRKSLIQQDKIKGV